MPVGRCSLKDDRLIYEHNYVGLERYRVISTETIPEGSVKLGMEFKVTGAFDISPDLTVMGVQGVKGEVTLYIGDRPVGSGMIAKTVPFGWSLSGEGLCCGYDSETPVSDLYRSPFRFTGQIDRRVGLGQRAAVQPRGQRSRERVHRAVAVWPQFSDTSAVAWTNLRSTTGV